MKAIFSFKSCRRLKTISTPTLVIHGKKDVLSPCQNAENISKLIPGAHLEIFENSAHMIFEEDFENALKCVIKFLK
jgi:pimeloyl-ACP methyl ester carboxylesterase